MTHDEMIAVIQAHKDGKQIQALDLEDYLITGEEEWFDVDPLWNFASYDFRVKPEPREV